MKPKPYWLLLIAVLVLFSIVDWTNSAPSESPGPSQRVTREYKTIRVSKALRDDELDVMGAQGWELVLYDPAFRGPAQTKELITSNG